jgi:hypothetical protein
MTSETRGNPGPARTSHVTEELSMPTSMPTRCEGWTPTLQPTTGAT